MNKNEMTTKKLNKIQQAEALFLEVKTEFDSVNNELIALLENKPEIMNWGWSVKVDSLRQELGEVNSQKNLAEAMLRMMYYNKVRRHCSPVEANRLVNRAIADINGK
jgi:hypothetical protein